jgi:hypothetical protein
MLLIINSSRPASSSTPNARSSFIAMQTDEILSTFAGATVAGLSLILFH